jgi:hypothetical protein
LEPGSAYFGNSAFEKEKRADARMAAFEAQAQRDSGSDSNLPSAQNPLAKNNSFICSRQNFVWSSTKPRGFYGMIFMQCRRRQSSSRLAPGQRS